MAGQTIKVSVLADTKRFSRSMKNLGRNTGLSALGRGFQRVGRSMMNFFRRGIRYATLLGAALGALAVKGGVTRALDLDTARKQMKQFGLGAKDIDKVSKSINKLVTGTPFSSATMHTLFSQVYAATDDIKQGLQVVKNAGNLTALSLTQDLGMVTDVMARVAAQGKVTGGDLSMLSRAGIPIRSILAKSLNITGEELDTIVANGELTNEEFNKALKNSDLLAGAAENVGKTWRAAFQNIKNWAEVLISGFVEGFMPSAAKGAKALNKRMEEMAGSFESAGKAAGEWMREVAGPAVKQAWGWIQENIVPVLESLWRITADYLVPALKELVEIIGDTLQNVFDRLNDALEEAGFEGEDLADVLGGALYIAIITISNVLSVLIGTVAAVIEMFIRLAGWAKDLYEGIEDAFEKISSAGAVLKNAIHAKLVVPVSTFFRETLPNAARAMLAQVTGAVASMVASFTNAWTGIKNALDNIRTKIINWGSGALNWLVGTGKQAIMGLKSGIADAMRSIKDWLKRNVWEPIKTGIKALFGIKSPSTEFAWFGTQMIKGLAKGLIESHPAAVVKNAFGGVTDAAHSALGWLFDKGEIGLGALGGLSGKVLSKLGGSLGGLLGGGGGGGAGGGVGRWRSTIVKALAMNGIPPTKAYVDAWMRQIATESGGNAKIRQQIVDINTIKGTPAAGLLQTIGPTFHANKFPGHGDIFNGFDNALAAIRYALRRYGLAGMLSVIGKGHGYAGGTSSAARGWAWVGEHGPELMKFNGGEKVKTAQQSTSAAAASQTVLLAPESVNDIARAILAGASEVSTAQVVAGIDRFDRRTERRARLDVR